MEVGSLHGEKDDEHFNVGSMTLSKLFATQDTIILLNNIIWAQNFVPGNQKNCLASVEMLHISEKIMAFRSPPFTGQTN